MIANWDMFYPKEYQNIEAIKDFATTYLSDEAVKAMEEYKDSKEV